MKDLLSALLGFFITITILHILLNNCSFNIGCGKERMSNPAPVREIMMQELRSCNGPLAPPPEASDNLEGFAHIDASGTGVKSNLPITTPDKSDDMELPYGPMFRDFDTGGSAHGRVIP
jgi:hypothetical protein